MRPIKFRGKVNGVWWVADASDSGLWTAFWAAVDRETVGQWTGLIGEGKQELKQELYEGDIIKEDDETPYAVRWDRHLAQFALFWRDERKVDSNKEWHYESELDNILPYEIIGNIYDNIELLKE